MELTDRAIGLLQEKGWIRYDVESEHGYCMLGALGAANSRLGGQAEERRLGMERILRSIYQVLNNRGCRDISYGSYTDIPYWNDQVARDADEVIEVLKLAGELADQPNG